MIFLIMCSRGQLGHGCLEEEASPRIVSALEGLKIIGIAAGGWHSLVVSGKRKKKAQFYDTI